MNKGRLLRTFEETARLISPVIQEYNFGSSVKHEWEKLDTGGTHLSTGIVEYNKEKGPHCGCHNQMKAGDA